MVVYFFYDSVCIGGVEKLFSDLCLEFNKIGITAYVIATDDQSIYYSLLPSKFIVKNVEGEGATVITPLSSAYDLIKIKMTGSYKVVLWSLQPTNCVAMTPFINRLSVIDFNLSRISNKANFISYYFNKQLLLAAREKNALYVMDRANADGIQYFYGVNLSFKYFVPLFQEGGQEVLLEDIMVPCNPKSKKILWLGRFDRFKIEPLKEFIADNNDFEYVFIGGYDKSIEGQTNKSSFIKQVAPKDLCGVVREEMPDLAIGMGLSALNLALCGVPTIILNPAYSRKAYNGYFWLHESENYDLGAFKFKEIKPKYRYGTLSHFDRNEVLKLQNNFLKNNFNKNSTVEALLKAVALTSMTNLDIYYYWRFNFPVRAFK